MKRLNYSDVFFYEQVLPLDSLINTAKECSKLRRTASQSGAKQTLPPGLKVQLTNALYALGVGLIQSGIYREGIKCFEEALELISNDPSQYLVDEKVIPLELLSHDNLPVEFYSIVHTLTIFYYRSNQLPKFKDLISNNIFVERGTFFKTWLSELLYNEVARQKCLELQTEESFKHLIGVSQEWYMILKKIKTVARSDEPVLITGPSGVGKEVVAKAIHSESGRTNYVALNCSAINDELILSELYGAEKGSFTGAVVQIRGFCETVGQGTLFLDEIGDSSASFQAKLLRLLQEKEFTRVGGRETIEFKGRIIAATNCDIKKLIHDGAFREDLLWRINVHEIEIPPLSKRPLDIEELIFHFIGIYPDKNKRISIEAVNSICAFYEHREVDQFVQGKVLSSGKDKYEQSKIGKLMGIEMTQSLENNVRELKNIITRLIIETNDDTITLKDLPNQYANAASKSLPKIAYYQIPKSAALKDREKKDIMRALELTHGNQTQVAKLFRCTPQAISLRLKTLKISAKAYKE